MIIDHLWFWFWPEILRLRAIGRIAFPIFLFLVWFNWSYKFKPSLWITAVILQIPLMRAIWAGSAEAAYLNILMAIALARVFLDLYHSYFKYRHLPVWIWIAILTYPLLDWIVDYGSLLILFPLLWVAFKKFPKKIMTNIMFGIGVFIIHTYFQMTFEFSLIQRLFVITSYLITFISFVALSQHNYSLQSKNLLSKKSRDGFIYWFSSNALWIYFGHAIWLVVLNFLLLSV